ncbi:TonB-dependent hemoglobin/transferrin/lactoferrin family receptor [Phreatobacter stygius]|uniref:TonB-dependent hemoglobin/transferrin/lactoferrin family receptor n=1 Tax=Phreatobacter stygius TaxID=1940610 RepID=UPI001FE7F447|nr:TonB-dependent hemoglobin/transferrin/lactoferrin family receptor [Phreatobacter stygius]
MNNSAGTVTVITDRQIDRQLIQNPRDAVRNEPGLAVGNNPTRAGSSSYWIRGIGDNRVRQEIDGVRVPDYPGSNAGAGLYTRDFVDFDSLKRVEIIRGPASALYGSDAIGGVVSYVTKDPEDYLREVGRDWYAGTKLSFNSVDRSFAETFTGAARQGPWQALLMYTRRDGTETLINSATRRANPQNYQSNNLLAKIIYETPDSGRWRLTGEALWRGVGTNLLTDLSTSVAQSYAHDTNKRFRLSLDWTQQLSWAIADQVTAMVYWTDLDRQEHQDQYRRSVPAPAPAPANQLRVSDFDFRQVVLGTNIQFSAQRQLGGWDHQVVYGATVDFTMTSRPRARSQFNLVTGLPIPGPIAGETFPNKNFPDTQSTQAAFYVQDTAQFGALRIIPAIRFDYYHLTPRPDAAFYNSNPGFAIGNVSAFAVSPKLGATYDLNDTYRLFAQYARGFRAPPYDNANFAFSNQVQRYEILPNMNLKPETSDGFEGGLRARFANGSSFQVSAFYNLYHDFIDTVLVRTSPTGFQTFQYQNVSSVVIYGFEARGEWRINPEWSLTGAVAYARGINTITHQPINSVDPLTGVAGLRYDSGTGWGVEARMKAAAAKTLVDSTSQQPGVTTYKPGAYATFDLLGRYEINRNVTLNAGIMNIANARYFSAIDVAGIASNNANLELFRAPGRSFTMNVSARF